MTSTLIALIFQGFWFRSSYVLQSQYDAARHEIFLRHEAEINILILETINRLQQVAETSASLSGVGAALKTGNIPEVKKVFESLWPHLKGHEKAESAAIFQRDGSLVIAAGKNQFAKEHVMMTLASGSSKSEVHCHRHCDMTVTVPLIVSNETVGVIGLSLPLGDVIQSFRRVSGSDLGILLEMSMDDPHLSHYVKPWRSDLIAVTRPEINYSLIDEAASNYSFKRILAENVTIEKGGHIFELRPVRIATTEDSANSNLIVISDVTSDIGELDIALKGGVFFGVAGLVISEILLLVLLWGPMTRLRKTAAMLPLLAENAFAELRQTLLKAGGGTRFLRDETHIVNETAIALSFTLEEMQGQLLQRAEQLESRGEELEQEKEFVTSLLNTAHALIITQNEIGEIVLINHHGLLVSGYEEKDLVGRPFIELLNKSVEVLDIRYQLSELVKGERKEYHHETDLINSSNDLIHMSWYHAFLPGHGERANQILTVALDISERKEAEEHLGWLAAHDPLTGLINRRRFTEELEQAIATCNRYGHTCAVLYFDLDQFKDVNDTSGHLVGDQMLRCVARQLKVVARESDTLARLGGDEFALIVHETDSDDVALTADRLCKSLMEITVEGQGRFHRVSTSIGISLYPNHGDSIEELMANADIAMYQAKDAGRNRWRVFDKDEQGRERIQKRVYWNDKVKQAISSDTFTVHFQPILHVATQAISHYEALLRVFDDDGALLSPIYFIQSAEQSGLIVEMDKKIVEKVIAYQAILQKRGIEVRLSINLSGVSMRNTDIHEHIESSLEKYGVKPETIIFEITETSAVADIDATAAIMHAIKGLGCQFALDDFGVGFSSIYYLKQLPIDYLKIDGSFIKRLPEEPDDQVLVKALVEISKAFGQVTVAEFVETEEIMNELRKLGVDYAQGYFVDKPKPFEQLWLDLLDQMPAEPNGDDTEA